MKEVVLIKHGDKVMNAKEVAGVFRSLSNGKHLVRITAYTRRSLKQNAYYHGVVVPLVRKGLFDAGYQEVKDNSDAHEILKHLFLKKVMRNAETQEEIVIAGSTATLTTTEFNGFMEEVMQWASAYLGIVIPDPNQEMTMLCEEYKTANF